MTSIFLPSNKQKTITAMFGKAALNLFSFPEYVMNFDGCSKGNPGPGGSGAVIYHNTEEIFALKKYCGPKVTNNVAEYNGLLLGLEKAVELKIKHLVVRGDSQLIIKQMNREYKVTNEDMMMLFTKAKQFEKNIEKVEYHHVYRNLNGRADQLSNEALLENTLKN